MSKFEEVRRKSNVKISELTAMIHGSLENYTAFMNYIKTQNEMVAQEKISDLELSRTDLMERQIERTQKWRKAHGIDWYHKKTPRTVLNSPSDVIGGIGILMGLPCIELMGTDKQIAKWSHRVSNGDYITAYAQTELAHGSDVQSLMTTGIFIFD
jgi:acyl-CoA oxidase